MDSKTNAANATATNDDGEPLGGEVCLKLRDFDVRRYRRQLGMSQLAFAAHMQVPIDTLRKWEAGAVVPTFTDRFKAVLESWLQQELRRLRLVRT